METALLVGQVLLLLPVAGGVIYAFLCSIAVWVYARRRPQLAPRDGAAAVSLLKPVHGLEKDLERNLRSAFDQDHPDHQVVLSVQRPDDPALPLLRALAAEFGPERATVAVGSGESAGNGKIQNLVHALAAARHDLLVISDSDVRLRPDYLRAITAPLRDPGVGFACTLYRAVRAERWFERLELLSLHDFAVHVIFAEVTGASGFCLGPSLAVRRATLEAIGGLESLSEYLVEDFEIGRRIRRLGLRGALVPYSVETVVDLPSARAWWRHQLYWDQNTRAARPVGFAATVLVRPVAFALLFASVRLFDPLGLAVLGAALALRLGSSGLILARLGDREGLRNLALLPLRDLAGAATWLLALRRRSVSWRGAEFDLTGDGRMVRRAAPPAVERLDPCGGRRDAGRA